MTYYLRILAAVAVPTALALCMPVQAQTPEIDAMRARADQGNAAAQFILGFMYSNGRGVAQDDAVAVRWYRLAAEQGHASAQRDLGHMYECGQGVGEDAAEAVRWYRLAAEQGVAEAQYDLGFMYGTGAGCGHAQRNALGRGDNPLVRGGGNPLVAGRARGSDSGSYVSRGGLMSPIVRCGRREAEGLVGLEEDR